MLLILLPRSDAVLPVIVALGVVCGRPAGAIMSLHARLFEQNHEGPQEPDRSGRSLNLAFASLSKEWTDIASPGHDNDGALLLTERM